MLVGVNVRVTTVLLIAALTGVASAQVTDDAGDFVKSFVDAFEHYAQVSGEDLATAKAVVELLAGAPR